MSSFLLDANVVIAAVFADHEHHARVSAWLATVSAFAVCPIVEGALVRFTLRVGETPATATALVNGVRQHPKAVFLADDISYSEVDLTHLRGHRQVTDTYLAALATAHGHQLATLDSALVGNHPTAAVLVPDLGKRPGK